MLRDYVKDFNKDQFLKEFMQERGIKSKTEAVKACRKEIPREPKYQEKVISGLKEKYPEGFVRKINQGPYSQAGFPDVLFILNGHFFGFEIKRPVVGEVTALQLKTIKEIEEAGGTAGIIIWPEEAYAIIEEWRSSNK